MEVSIFARNMEVTPRLREYVERKVGKLERHLPHILQGAVEVARETTKSPQSRYVVQLTVIHGGTVLRSEEKSSDVYAAINNVVDVMDRRIGHYKGKLYERGRRGHAASVGTQTPRIVKDKKFILRVVSAEEAAEQMESLGHDFFLFINDRNDLVSLLYRRKDGDYGLIESELPEIGE